MMTVMQAMMDASAEHDRLEVEIGDAGRDIQAGLALHAQRLQGIGILRTANQEVAATADTDGGVGAETRTPGSSPNRRRNRHSDRHGIRGFPLAPAAAAHLRLQASQRARRWQW